MIRLLQNSDTGDGKNLMPEPLQNADPEYLLIGGKKVEVKSYTLDEILRQSAARLREKIFKERGVLVPEFDPALWVDLCPPTPEVESLPEPQTESDSQGNVAQVWANDEARTLAAGVYYLYSNF